MIKQILTRAVLVSALVFPLVSHAASVVVSGTIGSSAPITIGETTILSTADTGNANLLLAEGPYILSQSAMIQSLSFYVTTVGGQLRLGVYDATGPGGGPGSLKAQTDAFTPVAGWNTQPVVTPIVLPIGPYWEAYLPESNTLAFRKGSTVGISSEFYPQTFGSLPAVFSTTPLGGDEFHWSFYTTLTPSAPPPPTLLLNFVPAAPSVLGTIPLGSVVAQIVPSWSDGSPFTGTLSFGPPYSDDQGIFAISGTDLIVNPAGSGLSAYLDTVQYVTVVATQ